MAEKTKTLASTDKSDERTSLIAFVGSSCRPDKLRGMRKATREIITAALIWTTLSVAAIVVGGWLVSR
jgi:hypothetical protein